MTWIDSYERRIHIISEFSPPQNATLDYTEVNADLVIVASNPGHSIRVESALASAYLQYRKHADSLATLTIRDLDELIIMSDLLGLVMWDVCGAVIVAGDQYPTSRNDSHRRSALTTSEVIGKGKRLLTKHNISADRFKIGSALDLNRDLKSVVRLAETRVRMGCDFFITQPIFSADKALYFQDLYRKLIGKDLGAPVYYGLQVLKPGSLCFSNVPSNVNAEVEKFSDNLSHLKEIAERLVEQGQTCFYTVPPFYRGGRRDYPICAMLNDSLRSML